MLLQRQHFLFSYFKGLKYWSGRDLNQRPTSQQTGSYPVELTERSGFDWFIENKGVYFRGSGRLIFFCETFLHVLQVVCVPQQMVVQLG